MKLLGDTVLAWVCIAFWAAGAFGSLVVNKGSNWTFSPAADTLIAGQTPGAVVNVSANDEGSPGPQALTDGVVAPEGRTTRYMIGNNAVLTYPPPPLRRSMRWPVAPSTSVDKDAARCLRSPHHGAWRRNRRTRATITASQTASRTNQS